MVILEIDPYDIFTVPPAYVAAGRDLWAKLPDIAGTNRARLLMVASNWTKDTIMESFNQQTFSAEQLPPMLGMYRAMLETYLENNVTNTRFTRIFLVLDTAEPESSIGRLLATYGIRAKTITTPIPTPFNEVEDKFTRGIAPDGSRWGVVRSEMQQFGEVGIEVLHGLFALPFPLWMSLDIDTMPRRDGVDLLRRKIGSAKYTIQEAQDSEARASAGDVKESAQLLRAEIQRTGMGLHHLRLSVLVGGQDEAQLRERLAMVRSTSGLSMEKWESRIGLAQEMFSTRKIAPVHGSLVTTRGVLTTAGSAFTYRRRTDSTGIMIGFDTNQSPVHLHLFDRRHPSYNMVMLGQTGSGKTFAFQLMALRHLMLGCRIIMIDPQGNIDWSWLGDDLCQTVQLGTAHSQLNIIDVIYDELTNQVEHVLSILKLLGVYGNDPSDQLARAVLDRVLTSVYTPIWGTDARPTLPDVKRRLDALASSEGEREDVKRVAYTLSYRISQYTEGSQAGMFSKQSNVDFSLNAPITVFDISRLPSPEKEGNLRGALLSILVGNTSQAIRRLRRSDSPAKTAPIIWFIDEMGVLMRDPVIASNTSYEFKTARARYVSMVVADQDLHSLLGRDDGYGTRHGEPMLANSAIVAIFKQRKGESHSIDERFPDIPPSLRSAIYLQNLGQTVLQTPHDVMQVHVHPSEFERIVLSSRTQDRARRDEMIVKMKKLHQQ